MRRQRPWTATSAHPLPGDSVGGMPGDLGSMQGPGFDKGTKSVVYDQGDVDQGQNFLNPKPYTPKPLKP